MSLSLDAWEALWGPQKPRCGTGWGVCFDTHTLESGQGESDCKISSQQNEVLLLLILNRTCGASDWCIALAAAVSQSVGFCVSFMQTGPVAVSNLEQLASSGSHSVGASFRHAAKRYVLLILLFRIAPPGTTLTYARAECS